MARSTAPFVRERPRPRILVQRGDYIATRPRSGPANLWQMPVLLLSLGLFTLAAYLFIEPQPAPGFQQQQALTRVDLDAERFDAAIGRLNDLLATRPEAREEAEARLLLAEALDLQLRRNRRLDTPGAHRRIIQEIQVAYTLGSVPTVQTSDRLARSHEALGEVDEAAANYQRAVDLFEQAGKPQGALPMRRSAIDMLIAFGQQVTATETINRFLAVPELTDDERAWALGELARVHIDAGRHAEARNLLRAAAALAPDLAIQGQVSFRLGYAAWRLGERAEARHHLLLARQQLGEDHPQEAEVCYLLGRLAQDEQNFASAIAWFDLALNKESGARIGVRAAVARAIVLIISGEDEHGAVELARLAEEVARRPALRPVQAELLEAVQRSGRILASQQNFDMALELLAIEQGLDPQGAPEALARRGRYLDKLIEQAQATLESSEEDSPGAPNLHLRDLRRRAAEAHLDCAVQLAAAGDSGYPGFLWKAVEQFELAGSPAAAAKAIERFIGERPGDGIMAEALLRLARLQLAIGEDEKAMATVARLREEYAQSPTAIEGAILLAELYHRDQEFDQSLALLDELSQVPAPKFAQDRRARIAFLRGDCQRQLAVETIQTASGNGAEPQLAAAVADPEARRRLEIAEKHFAEAIELFAGYRSQSDSDGECERLAIFGRAHCLFDLGRYEEAIAIYQQATARYRDDLSVLTATLQIASANAALGRADHTRQAAREILRLLERIPAGSFESGAESLPRSYWERWLRHVEASGLW